MIAPSFEARLHAYMVGIAQNLNCWTVALNGTEDHVHMFVSLAKTITVSDFMENVKRDSSRWVNDHNLANGRFRWQDGYAAFSIGESGSRGLKQYIAKQKEHHRGVTFKEELVNFLKKYGVEYDEHYIWK